MEPFDDPDCPCHAAVEKINGKFPDSNWNFDDACEAWNKITEVIQDNDIAHPPSSDASYSCTCPRCGNVVCGWCV